MLYVLISHKVLDFDQNAIGKNKIKSLNLEKRNEVTKIRFLSLYLTKKK